MEAHMCLYFLRRQNKLEGQIPETIEGVVVTLNLSNNIFTGHIPLSFAKLESLELASCNQLPGTICQGLFQFWVWALCAFQVADLPLKHFFVFFFCISLNCFSLSLKFPWSCGLVLKHYHTICYNIILCLISSSIK